MRQGDVVVKKEKILYLELLRVVACFFVIVNHTVVGAFLPRQAGDKGWILLVAYFFLSKTAVPVFLMVSGVLLLGRVDSYRKNFKRAGRIALDIVIFSMLYYVWSCCHGAAEFDLIEYFKLIYHQNITNAYWYLYLYLGILLMMPLLQRLAAHMDGRDYWYLILLSVVFMGTMPIVVHYRSGLAYNFSFSVSFFSVYVGILFAGHFLANHVELRWQYALTGVLTLGVCIAFLVAGTYYEYRKSPDDYLFLEERTFFPIVLAAAAIFYLARWLGSVIRWELFWKVFRFLGECSFGIYLLSDLFVNTNIHMTFYNYLLYEKNVYYAVLGYELSIFFTGLVITAGLKQIPGIKKLL